MAFSSFVLTFLLFADWPAFRGPNGSGVAGGARLPAKLVRVWTTELPPGLSSPVVVGGRIYLTGLAGGQLATLALDRASGRILWQRAVDRQRSEKLHKLNHPASPSVAVGKGNLYSFFPDFGLVSYTAQGVERWRIPLGPFTNSYGLGTSPVLAGDKLILNVDQDGDSFIAAFDAASGRRLWRTPRPEAVSGHSTPILYKNWVIAPGSFRMDAYDVATGRIRWTAEGLPSEMKSVPVIAAGLIYIHGFNTPDHDPGRTPALPAFAGIPKANPTRLVREEAPTPQSQRGFGAIDFNKDTFVDEAEWGRYVRSKQAENALLAYRLDTGALAWKFQRSVPQLPSPLVYRGVVYMINEGGILTTLDAATGKPYKQARLRGEADIFYASPVAGDGKVYFSSHTGVITVLKAGPDHEVLAVNHLDGEILATPALADSRVYVRTRLALHCFGGE